MSVNNGLKLKGVLFLLLVSVLDTGALVIKNRKPSQQTNNRSHHLAVQPKTSKKVIKHNENPHTRSLRSKTPEPQAHNTKMVASKSKTPERHLSLETKSQGRALKDLMKASLPMVLSALLAYVVVTSPFIGFIIFCVPILLAGMGNLLHISNKRNLMQVDNNTPTVSNAKDAADIPNPTPKTHIVTGPGQNDVISETMEDISKRINQRDVILEERRLMNFFKQQHVPLGQPIKKATFIGLMEKYFKRDKRFNYKGVTGELKTVVDAIYAKKNEIADIIKSAT